MKPRLLSGVLAALALMTAGTHFSGAAVTGSSANPSNTFAAAAVFWSIALDDPGANLRGTAVALSVTSSATFASITYQRTPAGGSTWTDICTSSSPPYTCNFDTTSAGDGLYDLRAAADTGTTTVYSNVVANRRVDNTAPTATMTDPGQYLVGTISLQASAADTGGSGIFALTIQRKPSSGGTWTDVCSQNSSPLSCSTDTTTWGGDGSYDVRAVAMDAAGNPSAYSTVANRTVDNTAPTATDIQTTNGGGTAGKVEQNDTIVFTFSENLDPATIVSGWNGSGSVTVDVTFSDAGPGGGNDTFAITNPSAGGAAVLVNGSVTLGNDYVTRTTSFSGSTLTRDTTNHTVTIALSAPSPGNANFRPGGPGNGGMSWPVLSTLKDPAGQSISTASVTESGTADREF